MGKVIMQKRAEDARIALYHRPPLRGFRAGDFLKAGEIPLNRVAKTDYLNLRERAAAAVRELRAEGKWDRG